MTHTDCSAGGGWGFGDLLDVPGLIVGAITSFLGTLIEQVMQPVRELLADTLLSTPDVTAQADIQRLWTGSLGIAAGIYVLFVTAGGITVMGYETVQTRYALKQIAPRLLLGMVAAATSLTVMGKAIALANALSQAVMGIDLSDAGQGLVERVVPFNLFGAAGSRLYLLIIAVVVVVLILAVLLGYMVRVALMAVLAVAAPLALSCHAHPLTEAVARLWWRALAGCLVIQVAQSMTFIVALKLFFAPGATVLGLPKPSQVGTMLAGLALFWVLFKTPGWSMRLVFRSTPISTQLPVPLRMLQSVALWRLMNHYLPGAAGLRRRGGGGTGGHGGPSSGGGGSGGGGGGGGRPAGPGLGLAGYAWRRGRALASGIPTRRGTAGTGKGNTGASSPSPRVAPSAGSSSATGPQGTRSVIHPGKARHMQQLRLPIRAQRVPARGSRPTQTWLPITAQRVPRVTPGARTASSAAAPSTPTIRARQLALPVPATRVRLRPARPVQLRLPLEPPLPPGSPGGEPS